MQNNLTITENKDFVIELAGVPIGIKPWKAKYMKYFCKGYLSSKEPCFILQPTEEAVRAEKERSAGKKEWANIRENTWERVVVYREIAERMPAYNTFLMHASAVALEGNAYLFAGPSGAGKSTHAGLWHQAFPEKLLIINDDKPLIKMEEDRILVCGSPWCGKEGWNNNISAPLKAVFFIHQAEQNQISPLPRSQGFEALMNQVYLSRNPENMQKTLGFVEALTQRIPLYSLDCRMDQEAVSTAYEAVKG